MSLDGIPPILCIFLLVCLVERVVLLKLGVGQLIKTLLLVAYLALLDEHLDEVGLVGID